jgi:hypothetical protein
VKETEAVMNTVAANVMMLKQKRTMRFALADIVIIISNIVAKLLALITVK